MNVIDDLHYVTPEDASKKICPMEMTEYHCLGPKCMAWRWHYRGGRTIFWAQSYLTPEPLDHWIRVGDAPGAELIDRPSGHFVEGPTKGYCGMVKTQ